jgi:hypothetical protein
MSTITIRPFAAIKLLTFALLATAGCHFPGIRGNGHVVTETRAVSDFTSVEADGSFTISWTKGATALQIKTDKNLLNHIETSVEGTKLRLHSHGQLRPTKGVKVMLSSSNLNGAHLTGAVRLTAARVSGKGFYLDQEGATRAVVDGNVEELLGTMAGASRLEAESLHAQNVEISISGAGRADVTAEKILKVSITGAGKVTYSGDPTVEKHVSGIGSIRQRD